MLRTEAGPADATIDQDLSPRGLQPREQGRGCAACLQRGQPRLRPFPQAGQAGGAGGGGTGLRGRGARRCSGVARQPPRASPVSGLGGVEEPQCQESGWPLAKAAGGECVPDAPGSPERRTLSPLSCRQGRGPGVLQAAWSCRPTGCDGAAQVWGLPAGPRWTPRAACPLSLAESEGQTQPGASRSWWSSVARGMPAEPPPLLL